MTTISARVYAMLVIGKGGSTRLMYDLHTVLYWNNIKETSFDEVIILDVYKYVRMRRSMCHVSFKPTKGGSG